VEYDPFRFGVVASGLALLASFGCAILTASIDSGHTKQAVVAKRLGVWLRAIGLGVIAFDCVFLCLALSRAKVNWPPNSTPEILVARPVYYFGLWAYSDERPEIRQAGKDVQLFFDRHRGFTPYVVEGVISWGVLGACVGFGLAFLHRFGVAPPWRQVTILGLTALTFLVLARIMFPVQPIGYV